MAKNHLVLEQSLESDGRKIASNLKNLKGENIFALMSYYKRKISKQLYDLLTVKRKVLVERALTAASAISNSIINDTSFPFLLFIRDG